MNIYISFLSLLSIKIAIGLLFFAYVDGATGTPIAVGSINAEIFPFR